MARRIVVFSALIALAFVAGLLAYGFYAPVKGVAAGCSLFGGADVASLAVPQHGCVKGYFEPGGGLAEIDDRTSYAVSLDLAAVRCDFHPHQFVVVRGHTVSDEGRIVVAVEACG